MKKLIVSLLFVMLSSSVVLSSDLPEAQYVPGQLIIKQRSIGISISSVGKSLQGVLDKYQGREISSLKSPSKGGYSISSASEEKVSLLQFSSESDLDEIKRELNSVGSVEYCEPNYYVFAGEELDKQFVSGFGGFSVKSAISSAESVVVAVVDTGVDYTHSYLSNRMWTNTGEVPDNGVDDDGNGYIDDVYGYDFYNYSSGGGDSDPKDGMGHGTHVAGIVSGVANSSLGLGSTNFSNKIMALKFLNDSGMGTQYDAAYAINYAADNGADVINCSWGYFAKTKILEDSISYARAKGVIIVASAGNNNWDYSQYPAAFDGVIAVSALDGNDRKAGFSNYGNYIKVSAPGVSIVSTYKNNMYCTMSGTSQAAPLAAGIIAYLKSESDDINSNDLVELVYQETSDILDPKNQGENLVGWDQFTGFGKVDCLSALNSVQSINSGVQTLAVSDLKLTKVYNYPNPARISTQFGYEVNKSADVTIEIYDLYGQKVRTISTVGSIGYNKTIFWDLTDDYGQNLANGTYIYILSATSTITGETVAKKQKLAILR